ncbi:MAG: NADH:flavin oxidoreductase/NADH oxidase family protein [Myxococcales bacterium]|nr:NADH:flavin oxidoreductase/NADH oxidase family protein [Myxococcales bacterium]
MTETSSIAQPLTLPSGLVLPNRVAKAAMSENLATADGVPTEGLARLYQRFARGGAGLFITGNAIVDPGGRTERHNVVMDRDHGEALAAWARAAKSHGAAVLMQLSHAGRQTMRTVTWKPLAPSAVVVDRKGGLFSAPSPLTLSQIEGLVVRFGRAAAFAEAAGFDGVQIHGAHGYLVSQFLSPLTNRRDDRYGGDLDGRMRFLLEIVREVRRSTAKGFTLAVKLNSADFQRGGFTLEESMQVAQALEAEGIDLLEISGGSYEKPAMMGSEQRASTRAREAFFLEYAERMRQHVGLPLMVTGGFRSREGMDAALRSGATDVVGMARPLAVDPDLPGRLLRSEAEAATEHPVGVGVRLLDDLLQIQWYLRQLARMSKGLPPDPRLSPWRTILGALGQMYVELATSWWRREGHALDAPAPATGTPATKAATSA